MRKFSRLWAALSIVGALTAGAGSAFAGGTSTTTTVITASSVNPSTVGQNTTLTATVNQTSNAFNTCTGTVTFMNGATPLVCAAPPRNISGASPTYTATCTVSFPTGGPQSLTASYAGGGSCIASNSGTFTQNVNAVAAVPTLGGWAAFLFTALMIGGGLWVMARRNSASPFTPA